MGLQVFRKTTQLDHPAETVYRWHARPGALQRLSPPWETVRLLEQAGSIEDGERAVLEVAVGPIPVTWVAEHRQNIPGRQFMDVQIQGPFARWEHAHRFEPIDEGRSQLEDRVEYALPLDPAARAVFGPLVAHRIRRSFDFRHRVTARDLALHARYGLGGPRRIAISGASGLLGSALCDVLSTGGHAPIALARASSRLPVSAAESVHWDPRSGTVERDRLEGVDFAVHLAGESIASGRWSADRRRSIRESRVHGTKLLAETLAGLDDPPSALICASATGWYGDRGDEELHEGSPPGSGFLAEVCREWESAAAPAREAGIRVVHLRFGMILWPAAGALARMLPPFRIGAGGRLGSGRQFWSWVSLDDAVGSILHAAGTEDLHGPVNVVAPRALPNREFTDVLSRVLARPALVPVPAAALRLALGDMADDLLLASSRVVPARLLESGFAFRDPDLASALQHMLGRTE